jgi:hypothetical protein
MFLRREPLVPRGSLPFSAAASFRTFVEPALRALAPTPSAAASLRLAKPASRGGSHSLSLRDGGGLTLDEA